MVKVIFFYHVFFLFYVDMVILFMSVRSIFLEVMVIDYTSFICVLSGYSEKIC